MGAVYIDWGRNNTGMQHEAATRSAMSTLMEMYQTSMVQISSCNNQRNLQFFQFFGFQIAFQEIDELLPIQTIRLLGITSLVRS